MSCVDQASDLSVTVAQEGITVENYANQGKVNGPAVITGGTAPGLTAFPVTAGKAATAKSKLNVGLTAFAPGYAAGLTRGMFGPYWVIAVGEGDQGTWRQCKAIL
jgi:hypothetical protein